MGVEVFMEKGGIVGRMADGEVYQKARKDGASHEKAMQISDADQHEKLLRLTNSPTICTASRKHGF